MSSRWGTARARTGQVRRIIQRDGLGGLAGRAARRAYSRLDAGRWEFPLADGDVVSSDEVPPRRLSSPTPGDRLRIGWVMVPPGKGSGGHTTAFRAIESLERAGHHCEVLLYDRYDGSLASHAEVIRQGWPRVRATIRDVSEGAGGLDALIATSWQTAHVIAPLNGEVRRSFYFVQDYEPLFYPLGAEYFFAEDTYRFGFHGLTAGSWLSEMLGERYGMACDPFEFGADTDIYRHDPNGERDGVVFYAKPGVPRRGYALGVEALRRFHAARPQAQVHLFGDRVGSTPFPSQDHGRMTPTALADLYNTCRAGLSLSFTNVSLIPWELAACGAVPVVNDAAQNRRVLTADHVAWAPASAGGLANAMISAYDGYTPEIGRLCAAAVQGRSWAAALETVVAAVEREVGLRPNG